MSNQKTDLFEKKFLQKITDEIVRTFNRFLKFRGSKLFLKCFVWFCFTSFIAFVVASTYGYFYHYRPAKEEFINMTMGFLEENGRMMVEIYEQNGDIDLNNFKGFENIRLYDEQHKVLFDGILARCNKHIQEESNFDDKYKKLRSPNIIWMKRLLTFFQVNEDKIQNFVENLFEKKEADILKIEEETIAGCYLTSASNKNYVAIVHVPRRIPLPVNELWLNRAKEVFPLFIIVFAVICYFMARYIAKPIIELQEASRKFAEGDFSEKITPNTLKRIDEIGDLANDFNNMAERIELGINSQKRLFNDISHELRSPLARMQVGIELLQMKLIDDSEKNLINRLDKELNRMNALIDELLNFSKLENKEIAKANELLNLGNILEDVCNNAEFEGNIKHKGVKLEIKHNSEIKGNSALIERALENVIRNGLRFTPENTFVEVELDKSDNNAIIKISDYGPGVPENDIKKIFAPFYCVKLDRNPQKGGIGLGLAIALRAIQYHKGSIVMNNLERGGLSATIELPLN